MAVIWSESTLPVASIQETMKDWPDFSQARQLASFSGAAVPVEYSRIVAHGHKVEVQQTTHRGLCALNDKVWQLSWDAARPLGHWRNRA